MRGRAAMLVYFFDHYVWWVRNAAGLPEPAERQFDVFAGIGRIAEQKPKQEVQKEHEDTDVGPAGEEGIRLRKQEREEAHQKEGKLKKKKKEKQKRFWFF